MVIADYRLFPIARQPLYKKIKSETAGGDFLANLTEKKTYFQTPQK